jgi:hypothetical protein
MVNGTAHRALRLAVGGLLAVLLGAASPRPASAAIINPISASTDMGSGLGTNLVNTINRMRLASFPSLTANHVTFTVFNSWVSSTGGVTGNVTFDLGGLFLVDGFSFWSLAPPSTPPLRISGGDGPVLHG